MRRPGVMLGLLLLPALVLAAPPLVEEAWIRLLPADLPMSGYLVLRNPGDRGLVLLGAHSPAFGSIEIHQSQSESGVARMARLERIAIAPHSRVVFAPGGTHLMMFERQRPLQPGDRVPVALEFEDGYQLQMSFAVREATAQ